MRSYVLLLLCASGCDLIFTIEPRPENVCGRFSEPVALTFDASLSNPKYFSARKQAKAGEPDYGSVFASRTVGAMVTTKVFIVQREPGTDTWNLAQGTRNSALLDGTIGGSMGEIDFGMKDELFIWRQTPETVFRAELTGSGYSTTGGALLAPTENNITLGNVIEVLEEVPGSSPPMMRAQRKRGVFTLEPKSGVGKNQLVFADDIVPYNDGEWGLDANRTRPLNIEADLAPGRGVITKDTFTLVYAAKFQNGDSNLYASRRDETTRQWGRGDLIDDLNTDMDETDPWINDDCSEIYFSRAGVTYRAARLAD